eukprot:jgi/Mesen1/5701/ME000288S04912
MRSLAPQAFLRGGKRFGFRYLSYKWRPDGTFGSKDNDLYKILGVPSTCVQDDIKKAFYRHAKLVHPDVQARHGPAASEEWDSDSFLRIAAAYEVLSDPRRRHLYDAELKASLAGRLRGSPDRRSSTSSPSSAEEEEEEERHRLTRHAGPYPGFYSGLPGASRRSRGKEEGEEGQPPDAAEWVRHYRSLVARALHGAPAIEEGFQEPAGGVLSNVPHVGGLARSARRQVAGELHGALRAAYYGPPLEEQFVALPVLPARFEAEVRSDVEGTADVMHVVSGRTLLGIVRERRGRRGGSADELPLLPLEELQQGQQQQQRRRGGARVRLREEGPGVKIPTAMARETAAVAGGASSSGGPNDPSFVTLELEINGQIVAEAHRARVRPPPSSSDATFGSASPSPSSSGSTCTSSSSSSASSGDEESPSFLTREDLCTSRGHAGKPASDDTWEAWPGGTHSGAESCVHPQTGVAGVGALDPSPGKGAQVAGAGHLPRGSGSGNVDDAFVDCISVYCALPAAAAAAAAVGGGGSLDSKVGGRQSGLLSQEEEGSSPAGGEEILGAAEGGREGKGREGRGTGEGGGGTGAEGEQGRGSSRSWPHAPPPGGECTTSSGPAAAGVESPPRALLGRVYGLGSVDRGGAKECAVRGPGGNRTHSVVYYRMPGVKNLVWYGGRGAGGDVQRCECRCTRASLPPSSEAHDAGGWYFEIYPEGPSGSRAGANPYTSLFGRRGRSSFDAAADLPVPLGGHAQERLHPAVYILAAAYKTLDDEAAEKARRKKSWFGSFFGSSPV